MSDSITVTDNTEEKRFDISVDGAAAGFSAYLDTEQDGAAQRILYHTVVHEEFGGRGLAAILTRGAVSQSVEAGRRIVPVCPYVKRWVEKNEDFAAHIDPATSAHLALLG